jgi:HPt (histidine-containing phosphotransfer) domain-containing protein
MNVVLDLTYLNTISEGDKEFINDILNTFLEEMPKDMEQMSKAIELNDNVLVGKMAHKVKATLHLLGLEELKSLALKIEQTAKENQEHPEIQHWAKNLIISMDKVYPNIQTALQPLL